MSNDRSHYPALLWIPERRFATTLRHCGASLRLGPRSASGAEIWTGGRVGRTESGVFGDAIPAHVTAEIPTALRSRYGVSER